MTDPTGGDTGPSILDRMNKGQLGIGAAEAEGADSCVLCNILSRIFPFLSFNSTNLDGDLFNLSKVFSGMNAQASAVIAALSARGGSWLGDLLSRTGFVAGGNIFNETAPGPGGAAVSGEISAAATSTTTAGVAADGADIPNSAASEDSGDTQHASLNTIPSSAIHGAIDAASSIIPVTQNIANNAPPPPKTTRSAAIDR